MNRDSNSDDWGGLFISVTDIETFFMRIRDTTSQGSQILEKIVRQIIKTDESCYSSSSDITSSAAAMIDGGIVMPMVFAVARLITSSSLAGCANGISAGRAPCSIW